MKSVRLWVFLFVSLLSIPCAFADTYVHGYYRKNGTYVAPHYRSSPDGDFSNNWSTRGNINPYTGQMGTKDYSSSSTSSYGGLNGSFGADSSYAVPGSLGNSNYQSPNYSPGTIPINSNRNLPSLSPLDESNRISVSDRLQKMGYNVDWQKHSLAQMTDLESRIGISKRLQSMGEDVLWQHKTLADLLDTQSRIESAIRLKKMGQSIDWKDHSLGELLNMETMATASANNP